ncbi:MAG: hypothetical protein JJT94_09080 [Bernardetiaceae bacterium]|nr:hypothetical protein [Bernardetiaceae bacterium]
MLSIITLFLYRILTFIVLVFLFVLRLHNTIQLPLTDYDAVKLWRASHLALHNDWSQFYAHAAPTLNALNLLLLAVQNETYMLIIAQASFEILGLYLLIKLCKSVYKLTYIERLWLWIFVGTSFYAVHQSRFLSVELLSRLGFIMAFFIAFSYIKKKTDTAWLLCVAALLGLTFTVNYKTLLLLPFFVFFVVDIKYKPLNLRAKLKFKDTVFAIFIFTLPFIFYSFIGGKSYLSQVYYLVFASKLQSHTGAPLYDWNLDFYPKYLFFYENPLLWSIPILYFISYIFIVFRLNPRLQKPFEPLLLWLIFLGVGMFLLMSFFPKAPRALQWVYPFYYLLSFILLKKWLFIILPHSKNGREWIMGLLILASVSLQLYRIDKDILSYSHKSYYAKAADEIKQRNIKKIALTVGINIVPYLDSDVVYRVVRDSDELASAQAEGYTWVLYDNYCMITDHLFPGLQSCQAVWESKEPTLLMPMHYLEHAQYSNWTFDEAMARQRAVAYNKQDLRLIFMPTNRCL